MAIDSVNHLLLIQELLAEYEEIQRHKWIESEKVGYDVGLEHARLDWRIKYYIPWREWRRSTRLALVQSPHLSF